MTDSLYHWLKAAHIVAVISWMAGMLYLPRLFAYHTRVAKGSEASELFKVMERRLLRIIINPAMIATWILGLWLAVILNAFDPANGSWLHAKLALVLLLSALHGLLAKYRKDFERDANMKSEKFYRILNEIPAVLMVLIVVLVVVRPF